jgi:hypothetical protein
MEEKMENEMFVGAETVAKDFGVSKSTAYVLIKKLNEELDGQGYLTVAGRVSRQYYRERIYGLTCAERGVENASI